MPEQQVTEIEIAYGGEAYADHEIDAKTLGEALSSLHDLIENAEKIINGETADAQVNIRATPEGSFTILVSVLGGLNTLQALGLAAGVGLGAGSLMGILDWLRGRQLGEVTIDENSDTATLEVDGEVVNCSNDVQKLVTSPIIRREIDKLVFKPLQTELPSTFNLKTENQNVLNITQEQVSIYKAPRSTVEERTHVDTREANVKFTIVNFKGANGWKMTFADGEEVAVKMEDEAFLERVNLNQAAFCKDDLYVVELSETIKESSGQMGKSRYTIIHVIRHRAAAERRLV